MSGTVVIRLGWYSPLRSALFAAFFGGIGYWGAVQDSPDSGTAEPDWAVLWFTGTIAAIFVMAMLRSLWLILLGRPVATLSAEGLRASACDDVLVPWEKVTSVTRTAEHPSLWLSSSPVAPLIEAAFRHDAYEVVLDPQVRDLGVKHSQNLLTLGFKLIPLKLSLSSRRIAETFVRYLPAERCVGFDRTDEATTAGDVAGRAALVAAAVAVGTIERMEAEQATPDEPAPADTAATPPTEAGAS